DPPPLVRPLHAPAGMSDANAVQGTPAATPVALPRINNLRRRVPCSETRLEEDVLAVILTSGDGTPLEALTHWRCMAALPFAGLYRSIDFALSNCTNSGIRRVGVATQYKAHSLIQHRRRNADVTLAYMELPLADAGQCGVLSTDTDHWVRTFVEKPLAAANGHDTAERALVSLGVYVFDTNSLIDLLRQDASDPGSWHDFGHDILPAALAAGLRVLGLPFRDAATDDAGYCRDVGTVDGYWLANMELLAE